MIELRDLQYVRISTRNLDEAAAFAVDTLGLNIIGRTPDRLYLRSDFRHHNICYTRGEPGDHTVGLELKDWRGLDKAYSALQALGVSCGRGTPEEARDRFVHSFVWFRDPTGNRYELVVRPYEANRPYIPPRQTGITGFGHVGMNTTDPERDQNFWLDNFSVQVSDWIGPAPLLRIKNVHHQMALFPTRGPGIQHVNHQVETIDDLLRYFFFLTNKGVRIVFGPGRHATSGGYFLYFEGLDGLTYEFSTSDRCIITDPENYRPRQFAMENESFCVIGAKPDIKEFRAA